MIRQRDPADRAVCQAIRDGHAEQALADLWARGRVHLSADPAASLKEVVYAWDHHRQQVGLFRVAIVTDTDNHTIDLLNRLCQAKLQRAGELWGAGVEAVDRQTGRRERLYGGDHVCFTRPYHSNDSDDYHRVHVVNGTRGAVLQVQPAEVGADAQRDGQPTKHEEHTARGGRVLVELDDGRQVWVTPHQHQDAQVLRLAYAGHALRLQGGQAKVVLVVPGSWQTSRQSAYSMLTRCVEEVHLFVDRQTQCTGPYAALGPLAALAQRWTVDGRKHPASARLLELDAETDAEHAVVGSAVPRIGGVPPREWERPYITPPHERADLDEPTCPPPRAPEEAMRRRALAAELAALGTPVGSSEPLVGRELRDGLGLELDFE